jgi:tetratricopeptide (TPR) repeat protein
MYATQHTTTLIRNECSQLHGETGNQLSACMAKRFEELGLWGPAMSRYQVIDDYEKMVEMAIKNAEKDFLNQKFLDAAFGYEALINWTKENETKAVFRTKAKVAWASEAERYEKNGRFLEAAAMYEKKADKPERAKQAYRKYAQKLEILAEGMMPSKDRDECLSQAAKYYRKAGEEKKALELIMKMKSIQI